MKKMFTKQLSVTNLAIAAGLAVGGLLSAGSSFAQGGTYYSRFSNPTDHYSKSDPTDCDANGIQNIVGVADNDLTTYAFFTANNITAPYSCTGRYLFDVDLSLPLGKYSVAAGQQAGYRLRVPLASVLTVWVSILPSLHISEIQLIHLMLLTRNMQPVVAAAGLTFTVRT